MDGVTTFLNSTGRSFVDFAAVMLVQSSVLIVILLALDLILRKRVRAVVRYWLWMLVLLKLVLPTSLSLPTGLGYWFGDRLPEIAIEEAFVAEKPEPRPAAPVIVATETVTLGGPVTPAPPPSDVPARPTPPAPAKSEPAPSTPITAPAMTWQGLVFLAWLAAVAAMVLLLVQRMFFVRGLVAQSKPAGGSMLDVFERCQRQMRVRRQVGLKLSPVAASPSVCGLFRSIILIPEGLARKLDSQHLKSILLHELAHIKRGDLWVSFVQTLLQIAYIYSPLVWVANAVIRKVREQAVDEMVLAAMGDEAEDYPETLLNVSRLTFSRPALSLRLVGVVESKKALSGRIKHILSRPFPKTAKLGIAGFILILVFGAIALPMASRIEGRENQALVQILKEDGNRKRGNAAKKLMHNVRSGTIAPALAEEALQAVTRRLQKHPKSRGRRLDSYPYVCWEELELAWVLIENDKVPADYVSDFVQALEVVGCTYGKEGDGVFRLYGDLNIPRKDIITNYKLHLLSMNHEAAPAKKVLLDVFTRSEGGGLHWGREQDSKLNPEISANLELKAVWYQATDSFTESLPSVWTSKDSEPARIMRNASLRKLCEYTQVMTLSQESGWEGTFGSEVLNKDNSLNKFRATLPNGVTVELVGVCEHPTDGKQWWRPDGALLSEAPYYKHGREVTARLRSREGRDTYQFAVTMGGASEPHIDSRLSEIFPSERHWSIFDFGTQDSNGQAIKGMWGIGAYIDEGAKTASLVLSICAGKWLNLAVCDVNSLPRLVPWSPTPIEISEPYIDEGLERERRVSTDRVRIEQSSDGKRRAVSDRLRGRVRGRKRPGESDRIAAFAIDLSGRLEGHQYRMIAVDHKGKEHRPYKLTTYGDGDGLTGHTFSFEQLSVEDIRKFRLLSRPYQNVTFKNVSLKPNFRTVVEVEVEEKAGEERLRRVKSEDRLHLLALCLHEYARKHNALLPQNKDGLEECFENKADFRWMVENVEYVAKGASVNQRKGGNIVVAYDKTLLDKGKGTNVLFLDYSVRFVLTNELAKLGILDMPLEAEIESPKRVGAGEEAVRWTGQGQMSLRLLIPKERVEGLGLVMFDRNRKKFVEAFAKSGPAMPGLDDKSCQWYEADFELPDIAMVETHGGKKYVLAGRRGVTVGRDSRDGAGLVDATAVQGEGGNWAVEYELCSTAHGSLRGAAKQYAGHNMGVLVDGKMISTFVLEDDPGPRAIITGNLTEEQAVALAEQLKLGSPAVRELLIKGIDAGDLGKVKKLLALNRNLLEASCFCTDSRGPLLEATLVSNIEIMRYLLEQGADVNAKVEQAEGQFAGATALHMAAEYGTPDMVELLVSYGANVNAIDGQGFTPLAMAASRAKPGPPVEPDNAIIEHLISSGADVNARGESGLSALTMAVMMQGYWKGQPQDERAEPRLKSLQQTIELLLASGAQKDIFSAAGLGDTERVAAILEQDPSTVSARRAFGMEPLQMAAMGGHRETVRLLVERGGNVFTRDVSDSPFRYAALVGDLEMFKLLEQLRDKYKDRMRAGRREIYYYRTAMNSAIQQGHGEIVAHLVDQERDIKAELMEYGLLEAAGEGQVEVVRILLERGAQVYASATLYKAAESVYDRADPDATMERYIAIAKLLIESGADVNWKYTTGSTPLLRAASNLRSYEHKSVNTAFFELLMENGADVNARGKERKAGVALICAVQADNLELAKLLLEAGADPLAHGERASDVYNCMEVARGEENKEMIALLAKYAEPGYAAMKKIFGGTIKEFVEVVTKKNDEALMGVTSDSREYGRQQWPKHAEKIRTDYEGHYELLEKIVGVGTSRGFAALFLPRPEGGEQRYSKLLLMQFPDGGWRVLQFYPTDDSPDDAFKEARNAYESYDSYQRAVFDAAGRLEDVAAEIPTGMTTEMPDQGRLTVRVKDGNLRFDFLDQPEGRYKAVEVHKDKVKCWRSKDLLGVAGKLKLEKGDLRLEAKDGKATLSAPGKQYVIDAHEGKVRVQYEGKVLMADKFTFELPALELNSRS